MTNIYGASSALCLIWINASRMVVLVVNRVRHGDYPLNAVGAVQAQKDQTCNITSSFRVQPLAIWALA